MNFSICVVAPHMPTTVEETLIKLVSNRDPVIIGNSAHHDVNEPGIIWGTRSFKTIYPDEFAQSVLILYAPPLAVHDAYGMKEAADEQRALGDLESITGRMWDVVRTYELFERQLRLRFDQGARLVAQGLIDRSTDICPINRVFWAQKAQAEQARARMEARRAAMTAKSEETLSTSTSLSSQSLSETEIARRHERQGGLPWMNFWSAEWDATTKRVKSVLVSKGALGMPEGTTELWRHFKEIDFKSQTVIDRAAAFVNDNQKMLRMATYSYLFRFSRPGTARNAADPPNPVVDRMLPEFFRAGQLAVLGTRNRAPVTVQLGNPRSEKYGFRFTQLWAGGRTRYGHKVIYVVLVKPPRNPRGKPLELVMKTKLGGSFWKWLLQVHGIPVSIEGRPFDKYMLWVLNMCIAFYHGDKPFHAYTEYEYARVMFRSWLHVERQRDPDVMSVLARLRDEKVLALIAVLVRDDACQQRQVLKIINSWI
jgi:hypothetical protein